MVVLRKSVARWKPDVEAPKCEACETSFSFFNRRHHCRRCGGIFCDDCSAFTKVLPPVHPTVPQRVCERCVKERSGPSQHSTTKATSAPNSVKQPGASQQILAAPSSGHEGAIDLSLEEPAAGPCQEERGRNDTVTSAPDSNVRVPVLYRETEGSDSDDFDTPRAPDIASVIASAREITASTGVNDSISYLGALQQEVNNLHAGNVLNVLMYVAVDRQQAIVVTVEPFETMRDLATRLAENFHKLERTTFRRMSPREKEELVERLHFTSEYQILDGWLLAIDVISQCRSVVLSTVPPEKIIERQSSERSVRTFLRSDRSDGGEDVPL